MRVSINRLQWHSEFSSAPKDPQIIDILEDIGWKKTLWQGPQEMTICKFLEFLSLRNWPHRNITPLAEGKGAHVRISCERQGEIKNMEKAWSCVSISISDS